MARSIGFYRRLSDAPEANISMYYDYYWPAIDEDGADDMRLVIEIGDKSTHLTRDEVSTLIIELNESLNQWDEGATDMSRSMRGEIDKVDISNIELGVS